MIPKTRKKGQLKKEMKDLLLKMKDNEERRTKLYIKVEKIIGRCPVYEKGDIIILQGPEVNIKETDKICIHALGALLHYFPALEHNVAPEVLGLTADGDQAHIQCPDPGPPYTDGGTVVFSIQNKTEHENNLEV